MANGGGYMARQNNIRARKAGSKSEPHIGHHHLVKSLLQNNSLPDTKDRCDLVHFVAENLASETLTPDEKGLAFDILHRMAHDTSLMVRETISRCLADTPVLPRALALKLAHDIADIAEPVLLRSLALTDKDLIDIIAKGDEKKQISIAKRPVLRYSVTHALVEHASEKVVETALRNKGARLAERTARRASERFPDSLSIHAAISTHGDISKDVALDIVLHASVNIKHLIEHCIDLPPAFTESLIMQVHDRTIFNQIAGPSEEELLDLVHHIYKRGHLSDGLILRALIMGRKDLFEACCAIRTDTGLIPTRLQLYHRGPHMFHKFLECAGFSAMLDRVTALAVPLLRIADDSGSLDPAPYQTDLLAKIIANFRTLAPGSPEAVIAQLLNLSE